MLNKVILLGRLTKDPETRYTQSGTATTRFTIAVDRKYVKQGEERQTDFVNIVAFRSTAEFVGKWFTKGQLIVIVGSLQSRKWEDKDGKTQYGMDVVTEEVHFGESKKENGNGSPATKQTESNDTFLPVDETDFPF